MTVKILIPDQLTKAKSVGEFEQWMLFWKPTTCASMREENAALVALHTERFVRRNVSPQKFDEWLRENPRTFTTRSELNWLARRQSRI